MNSCDKRENDSIYRIEIEGVRMFTLQYDILDILMVYKMTHKRLLDATDPSTHTLTHIRNAFDAHPHKFVLACP